MRLDHAVAARFPAISRRLARQLIAARRVLVNDRPVAIASREVGQDDRITVAEALPELDVIRSTDDWIAVNKPAGMPTQPPQNRAVRSLEELLRVRFGTIYLVHRLDTPTSGVVVFARSAAAAAVLSELFASREVRKLYLARVEPPLGGEITIDSPLDGKDALTMARPRADGVVEVEIKTGRTHQIRRHLASIGHPVAGDRRYGSSSKPRRLMLHAWRLEHQMLGVLTAPPPAEFS